VHDPMREEKKGPWWTGRVKRILYGQLASIFLKSLPRTVTGAAEEVGSSFLFPLALPEISGMRPHTNVSVKDTQV
jgi:hypothetical protein